MLANRLKSRPSFVERKSLSENIRDEGHSFLKKSVIEAALIDRRDETMPCRSRTSYSSWKKSHCGKILGKDNRVPICLSSRSIHYIEAALMSSSRRHDATSQSYFMLLLRERFAKSFREQDHWVSICLSSLSRHYIEAAMMCLSRRYDATSQSYLMFLLEEKCVRKPFLSKTTH